LKIALGNPVHVVEQASRFELMRNWLIACTKSHKNCKRTVSNSEVERDEGVILPSRVLDVGTTENPRLNLVLTTGQCGRYVALSYCWGASANVNLRTTKSNVETFTETITEKSLPRTIKDAVQVARELCIQYLWVDSLCIVQDSEEDWRHESRYMGRIFENALCTVAATSAQHCDEGLFIAKPVEDGQQLQQNTASVSIPCVFEGVIYGSIFIDHLPDDGMDFDTDIANSRWNGRGWVVQERILSRRIIHFARNQLYWECQQIEHRERSKRPINHRTRLLSKPAIFQKLVRESTWFHTITDTHHNLSTVRSSLIALKDKARYMAGAASDLQEKAPMLLLRFWPRIVTTFNCCELTYDNDKLAAIQGLAKSVASLTSLTYFCGLWLEHPVK